MANKQFTLVGESPDSSQAPGGPTPTPSAETQRALHILMASLAVVNKRFIAALSHLFTAGALASAWVLWSRVLPDPTVNQLIGVSLFCMFILAIEWVRRL